MMDKHDIQADKSKDVCSCLCSDGRSVLVDLQTLCSYSGYFSALRQSEMQETISKNITFCLFSSDVLTLMTSLLHQYSMTKSWTPLLDNMSLPVIEDLLFVSDYLDIPSVRNMCDSWLSSTCSLIEIEPFGQLVFLCNRYNLELLRKEVDCYCKIHIMVIKDAVSVLDVLSFNIVKEVLESDETKVDSEWDLVNLVNKLFVHNEVITSVEQQNLLKFIRVPRLLVIENHQSLVDDLKNDIVKIYLQTALCSYNSNPKQYKKTYPWQFAVRQPRQAVICFRIPFAKYLPSALMVSPVCDVDMDLKPLGTKKDHSTYIGELSSQTVNKNTSNIPATDFSKNMELKFHNVPNELRSIASKNLREFGLTTLGRSVYLAGGQWRYSLAGQFALDSVMRLDLDTLQWHMETCMLSKRCLFSLVPADGQLLAIGGINSEGELSAVETFNPYDHTWTPVASLGYRVHEHSACVYEDDVYVSGGHNGHNHINTVSCYNVTSQVWRECTPMLFARSYHNMIECGGRLFVIGGCKFRRRHLITVQICEVYNMETSQWTQLVSKFPTHFTACLSTWVMGSDIILVGGYSFRQQKYRTKQYTLHTEDYTWTMEPVNFPNRTFGWKEAVFQKVLLGENIYGQTFLNKMEADEKNRNYSK